MTIEELQRHAELLSQLLKDPHHGLYTWNAAVAKERRALWHESESIPESESVPTRTQNGPTAPGQTQTTERKPAETGQTQTTKEQE
jgi:hypothetical protein